MLDACHVTEQKANECTGEVEEELVGGGRLARTSAAAETSAGRLTD